MSGTGDGNQRKINITDRCSVTGTGEFISSSFSFTCEGVTSLFSQHIDKVVSTRSLHTNTIVLN